MSIRPSPFKSAQSACFDFHTILAGSDVGGPTATLLVSDENVPSPTPQSSKLSCEK